jgi:hypothetical protein
MGEKPNFSVKKNNRSQNGTSGNGPKRGRAVKTEM